MKKASILFLQGVILLIGIVAIVILIRFPSTEGRAQHLDIFSIYTDPFILYGYATSIPFFLALYNTLKLLRLIGQNNAFTLNAVMTLRRIKYCAIVLSSLIVIAGVYIRIFHNKDDDPAGFLALCILTTFITLIVFTAVSVFEKIVGNGVDIKSENEQLHLKLKK
jgi:hypothetical protein